MAWVLAMTYLWLKAGHIIFVIFWMAGLFMLPRFFVYHQEAAPGSPENAVWIEREAKLLRIILWPSLVVVWVPCWRSLKPPTRRLVSGKSALTRDDLPTPDCPTNTLV